MTKMTSRQRMLSVLNHQEPDHIPCCFMPLMKEKLGDRICL